MSKLRPADICRRFHISRTTLFRWEQEGRIPRTERDELGRFYRARHTKRIARLLCKRLEDDRTASDESQEEACRIGFVAGAGERTDVVRRLGQLARKTGLNQRTVDSLIDEAARLPRGNALRSEIWKVLTADDQRTSRRAGKKRRARLTGKKPKTTSSR